MGEMVYLFAVSDTFLRGHSVSDLVAIELKGLQSVVQHQIWSIEYQIKSRCLNISFSIILHPELLRSRTLPLQDDARHFRISGVDFQPPDYTGRGPDSASSS
jgi:hypothetical protein